MSPIYPKLKEAGAVFEQVMGYERPSWFEPELSKGMNIQHWHSQNFFSGGVDQFL